AVPPAVALAAAGPGWRARCRRACSGALRAARTTRTTLAEPRLATGATPAGLGRRRSRQAGGIRQAKHILQGQLHPKTTPEPTRQHHGTIADPDQAADRMANGLEHTAHLAVAAFGNGHPVPA